MKNFRAGPIALTTTMTTNLLNPPTATGGVNGGSSPMYMRIRYIRFVNKDTAARTASLWLGATGANAAGTEVLSGKSIAPGDVYDWFPANMRLDSTDFLVGGASANSAISITIVGDIGVAG